MLSSLKKSNTPRFHISIEIIDELIEFNLSRPILVNLQNKVLNVDCHFKFILDGVDQLVSVDEAVAVCLPAHRYKCFQQLLLGRSALVFAFLLDELLELGVLEMA